jgi:hypothetical protein
MADNKAYATHDEEMIPLQVYVTAPATLPAGYTFEALVNDDPDRPFTCEVVRRTVSSCSQTPSSWLELRADLLSLFLSSSFF